MAFGNTVKGITIEFRGDTSKLGKAINEIDRETRSLDKELRDVNNALKFNPKNAELLAQKQTILGEKVTQTKNRLNALREAQKKLDDDPSVDKTSADYRELRRQIITTESKLKHFNGELKKLKYRNIRAMGEAFKSAGQKMRTAGMYASGAAAGMIMSGKKLLELNATQEQAETKLIEIYKERMGVDEEAAKSTMKLASALQQQGVIGDEVALSGAQQLATYAKYPETINKLLPSMENLLVQQKGTNATAEDATNIANLFGKAMNGQVGALKRVGISFNETQEEILKTGTEEEKAAVLAEVVTQNVGNMNKVFAETDAGKMQQVKNSLGDFGERLGHVLLPALAQVADWLNKKALPAIEKLVSYMEDNPIIPKILVGIAALLAVGGPLLMMIGTVITMIGMVGSAITVLTGPVGIVIASIAAAIAIGVALYKNWDKVKAKAKQFWQAIKSTFTRVGEAITAPIKKAVDFVKKMIDKIKAFFNFKVQLPHIKLPHFAIDPPGWKLGDLLKGVIPSLGIDWYKKGGIFTKPSVIGVGEAGAEAVLPIDKLNTMMMSMADSIVNGMSVAMAMQSAGSTPSQAQNIYLFPNGPKMGEVIVDTYNRYNPMIGRR